MYVAEIAPGARRGPFASAPQLATVLGICAGYFISYGCVKVESSFAWRFPFAIHGTFALALLAGCIILPSSPRWLVLHNRRDEAMRAIEWLGIHREEAEKDILRVKDADQGRSESSILSGFVTLFKRQYRMKTALALFVLGMVQLSGIDGVLYVRPVAVRTVKGAC